MTENNNGNSYLSYIENIDSLININPEEAAKVSSEFRATLKSDYESNLRARFNKKPEAVAQDLRNKVSIRTPAVFNAARDNVCRFQELISNASSYGLFMDTAATLFYVCNTYDKKIAGHIPSYS